MELHPLSTTEEQFNQYMSELHPIQYCCIKKAN